MVGISHARALYSIEFQYADNTSRDVQPRSRFGLGPVQSVQGQQAWTDRTGPMVSEIETGPRPIDGIESLDRLDRTDDSVALDRDRSVRPIRTEVFVVV